MRPGRLGSETGPGPADDLTAPGEGPRRELDGLTIGHFGQFNPDYPRNRTVAKALGRAGADVVTLSETGGFLTRTPRLVVRSARPRRRFDLLLVGFPAHADVPAARAVASARRIPLVFDPLVSLYEMAEDRDGTPPRGLRARRLGSEDRWSARLADRVLLDTSTHISWWSQRFDVPESNFRLVWIGADDELLQPHGRRPDDTFRVLFVGTFIPLQGLEHIIGAAAQVGSVDAGVRFQLIGSGQTQGMARKLAAELSLTNVDFVSLIPHEQLGPVMAQSDLCLGIFGATPKAARVIPNKAFEALAVARPLITADTPAAREVLVHGEHAWLVPAGDPQALAEAILHLRNDPGARDKLAQQGHDLFHREFSLDALARNLTGIVREVLDG